MTGDEIRRTITDIVEVIVESGRDLKVVFEDSDSQVMGGLNKRNRNTIEIHSYVQEKPNGNESEEDE